MIDWENDVDYDCPDCVCCTESDCCCSAECIVGMCPCYSDQPDRPSDEDDS